MTTASIEYGPMKEAFDVDEWVCVRYCYNNYGHTGPGSVLITGGDLNAEGVRHTRSMIQRVREGLLDQKLDYSIKYRQGLASRLLFDLVKKKWKLPYVHEYYVGDVVIQGTKRLGRVKADPSLLDLVPTFAEVPVFQAAFHKVERVFSDEGNGSARITLG